MSRTDVQGTLQEMWETRPARPRDDRQVAGVAAAIARRYDIDPVLVRVGFVVAAFGFIGPMLYIAGWIVLPNGPATTGKAAGPRPIMLVGLAIAAAMSFGFLFDGNAGGLWPAIAALVLLFLLHRSRSDRGRTDRAVDEGPAAPQASTGDAQSEAPTTATGPSLVKDRPADAEPAATPPAWDPLGAAPFAWDLPEPSSPPQPPPPRRLPVTPVTLGVALLAGGITAVIMLLVGAFSLANLPILLGVTLTVLGAGLVVGAFMRAGRGLIPFALVLSALTWAVVVAPLDQWRGNGFGELHEAPATVADLHPSYQRTAGEIHLDLRDLDLTVPAGGNDSPVRTSVSIGAGEVQVQLPPNADVTLTGTVGVGEVSFGGQQESGPGAEIEETDLGADGVRSGRMLILEAEAGAGSVEVNRG